jgi:hypothetical protein
VNCTLVKKSYSHDSPHNPIKNKHITAPEKIVQNTISLKVDINVYPAPLERDELGKYHVI